MVFDRLERPLKDIRISVTDRCNFRCRYCMPKEVFGADYPFLHKDELLSFAEIERLARIFVRCGVSKIRITGGEPLLRPQLAELIRMLAAIEGLEDIALTSNGVLLPKYARELKAAGLQRVNISLDSLNDERFGRINGVGARVRQVLRGVEAAAEAGLQVKINMVVQRGVNEQDVVPMARYFKDTDHMVRFIEYMDVGNTNGWKMDKVVSKQEILQDIESVMPLETIESIPKSGVASRYRYQDTKQEIGVISSVTEAFCATCTRARLSANGQLYTCLFATKGTDLRHYLRSGIQDERLQSIIEEIWVKRNDRYSEERGKKSSQHRQKIEMSYIGG